MSEAPHELQLRVRQIERRLQRQKKIMAAAATIVGILALYGFQDRPSEARFAELTVERLNVVEPDGSLVLVLANKDRLPDPLIAGRTIETARTGPGMIFFNGQGWEVGGLTYSTSTTDNGYRASGHFSFDQYHNDQVVYLSYQDDGVHKRSGLYVVDRARDPTIDRILEDPPSAADRRSLAAQRVFVGSEDETATLRMRDRSGRDRVRLTVAPDGTARLEFLDEKGEVVLSLPE